jgi:hypothetical protein
VCSIDVTRAFFWSNSTRYWEILETQHTPVLNRGTFVVRNSGDELMNKTIRSHTLTFNLKSQGESVHHYKLYCIVNKRFVGSMKFCWRPRYLGRDAFGMISVILRKKQLKWLNPAAWHCF